MVSKLCLGLVSLLTFVLNVSAIPTISAVGSKFFTSDGNQFFIKGVAYQLIEDDPLVNTNQCQLDAALMKTLGANTIRVYHVDASQDHSGCMNAFADVGIYLFVDMDTVGTYITEAGVPGWTQAKSDAYRAVFDNFQQYDNTAGFFVGNEVLNVASDAGSAPYVLAAATDLKAYRDAKGYRKIPVGYSATDTAVLRPMLQDYLVCNQNASERIDFYSLNSYEWCGQSSYTQSGYSILQSYAQDYPVPIFFSEDGCNTVPPRTFDDQASIFGPQMVGTWSGAIIYEWIQETNDYGLVNYGAFAGSNVIEGTSVINGYTRQGTPTPVSPDFSNLQAAWATLSPSGVALSAYSASASSIKPPACPSATLSGSNAWTLNPSIALPTVGEVGVSSGLPTGIPKGSITSGASGSATSTGSSSSASASAKSGGGKTNVNPLLTGESSFMGMFVALLTVGAAAIWWL